MLNSLVILIAFGINLGASEKNLGNLLWSLLFILDINSDNLYWIIFLSYMFCMFNIKLVKSGRISN